MIFMLLFLISYYYYIGTVYNCVFIFIYLIKHINLLLMLEKLDVLQNIDFSGSSGYYSKYFHCNIKY